MSKKKLVLEQNGNAKYGKPSRQTDATPLKQDTENKTAEETSTTLWLFGLVLVSFLSLVTRLYNLQQPPSVWLV